MNRQSKHHKARAAVAAKLGGMGLGVEDVPRTKGYDLLVNGEIRVALRVAFPGRYAHTVTVGGKRYTSKEAIRRFLSRLNERGALPPEPPSAGAIKAYAELGRMGC